MTVARRRDDATQMPHAEVRVRHENARGEDRDERPYTCKGSTSIEGGSHAPHDTTRRASRRSRSRRPWSVRLAGPQARGGRCGRRFSGGAVGGRVARTADRGAVPRAARGRYRARLHEPAERREAGRHVPLRRLRQCPLLFGRQVRQRHGLAELHPADRGGRGRDVRRLQAVLPAHRGALRRLRRPPGPYLRGRARTYGPSPLHQWCRHGVQAGRWQRSGRRLPARPSAPARSACGP